MAQGKGKKCCGKCRGMPGGVTITDTEIREALSGYVAAIVNAIRVALERTPPELSADIADHGIVLTGGGALLKNLDTRIRNDRGRLTAEKLKLAQKGTAAARPVELDFAAQHDLRGHAGTLRQADITLAARRRT